MNKLGFSNLWFQVFLSYLQIMKLDSAVDMCLQHFWWVWLTKVRWKTFCKVNFLNDHHFTWGPTFYRNENFWFYFCISNGFLFQCHLKCLSFEMSGIWNVRHLKCLSFEMLVIWSSIVIWNACHLKCVLFEMPVIWSYCHMK